MEVWFFCCFFTKRLFFTIEFLQKNNLSDIFEIKFQNFLFKTSLFILLTGRDALCLLFWNWQNSITNNENQILNKFFCWTLCDLLILMWMVNIPWPVQTIKKCYLYKFYEKCQCKQKQKFLSCSIICPIGVTFFKNLML